MLGSGLVGWKRWGSGRRVLDRCYGREAEEWNFNILGVTLGIFEFFLASLFVL